MTIIIAILIFSIIILFHEFGHFVLAKRNGIKVTEFALGMGPKLIGIQKGETLYSIRLLPFGGYCAMLGEDAASDEEVPEGDKDRTFNAKGVWQRISVVAAGPIFNFILAFIFAMFIVSVIGYDTPVVYDTQEGGPAYEAGLRKGDVIKSINGHDIHMYKEFRAYILFEGSEHTSFEIVYERDGVEHTTYVTPVDNGSGAYQILLSGGEYEKTDFFGVLKYSFYEVKYWITTTIQSLGMLVQGQVTADDVSGPVGIVSMIGETYQAAREYGALDVALNLANICILLSANLGVMNLLPIPALDGGRLVFLLLEAIRRKPVSREKEGMVHTVGLMLLMALMVFIMFNDVRKLF